MKRRTFLAGLCATPAIAAIHQPLAPSIKFLAPPKTATEIMKLYSAHDAKLARIFGKFHHDILAHGFAKIDLAQLTKDTPND